jgi:hypothetical protein
VVRQAVELMSRQRRQQRLDARRDRHGRRHEPGDAAPDEALRDHPGLPAEADAMPVPGVGDDETGTPPGEDLATGSVVWVHGDCLRPTNPALVAAPGKPALFVFDDALLDSTAVTLKRLVFLYECLLELPVTIRRGDVAAEVVAFARAHGAERVLTTASPAPRFAEIREAIAAELPVVVVPEVPFLAFGGHLDLRRFGRYWRVAQRYAYGQAGLPVEEWERGADGDPARSAGGGAVRLPGMEDG